MIGHVEALDVAPAIDHWKAHGLDISPILQIVDNPYGSVVPSDGRSGPRARPGARPGADPSGTGGHRRRHAGRDRTADPQRQSHGRHAARARGHQGLEGRRACRTTRSGSSSPVRPVRGSGRSCPRASRCASIGDTNDYLGKGLSGGELIVRPPRRVAVRRRRPGDRRQRDRVRRHRRRDLPAWHGRRTLLRHGTRVRPRSSRASATTVAST